MVDGASLCAATENICDTDPGNGPICLGAFGYYASVEACQPVLEAYFKCAADKFESYDNCDVTCYPVPGGIPNPMDPSGDPLPLTVGFLTECGEEFAGLAACTAPTE